MTVQVANDQELLQEFQDLIKEIGQVVAAESLMPVMKDFTEHTETAAATVQNSFDNWSTGQSQFLQGLQDQLEESNLEKLLQELRAFLSQTKALLEKESSALSATVKKLVEEHSQQRQTIEKLLEGLTADQKLLLRRVVTGLDAVRNDIEGLLHRQEESTEATQQKLFKSVDQLDQALDRKVEAMLEQAKVEIAQGNQQTKKQLTTLAERTDEQISLLTDGVLELAEGQRRQRRWITLLFGSTLVLATVTGVLAYLLLRG